MADLDKLLLVRHHRRWIFSLSFSALLLIVLGRFLLIPWMSGGKLPGIDQVVSQILDQLLTVVVAFIATTAVIIWLSPPTAPGGEVRVVQPFEVKGLLEECHRGATEYYYNGHIGRWARAVTLPQLSRDASATNLHKKICVALIDFRDTPLCNMYARYLNGFLGSDEKQWTEERVRCEAIATAISSFCWEAQESRISVEVGLVSNFSVLRVDLSSRGAVITTANPRLPSLFSDANSVYFRLFREDVALRMKQAYSLPPPADKFPLSDCNSRKIRGILKEWGLEEWRNPEAVASNICELVKNPTNPFPG